MIDDTTHAGDRSVKIFNLDPRVPRKPTSIDPHMLEARKVRSIAKGAAEPGQANYSVLTMFARTPKV